MPQAGTKRAGSSLRRRIQKETDKRRALLDAAHRVFRRLGYHGATVNDIIQEAGVSRATFYGYFSDKDDIFVTLYMEVQADLRRRMGLPGAGGRRLQPHPTDPERLRAAVKERIAMYFELWEQEQALMEGAMVLRVTSPKRAAPIFESARQQATAVIRWLRHDKEAGLLRSIEPELALEALVSTMQWLAFEYYTLKAVSVRHLSLQELSEQLTTLWFDGVYKPAHTCGQP